MAPWRRITREGTSKLVLDVYEDFSLEAYEDGQWRFIKGSRMVLAGKEMTEVKAQKEGLDRMVGWVDGLVKMVKEIGCLPAQDKKPSTD